MNPLLKNRSSNIVFRLVVPAKTRFLEIVFSKIVGQKSLSRNRFRERRFRNLDFPRTGGWPVSDDLSLGHGRSDGRPPAANYSGRPGTLRLGARARHQGLRQVHGRHQGASLGDVSSFFLSSDNSGFNYASCYRLPAPKLDVVVDYNAGSVTLTQTGLSRTPASVYLRLGDYVSIF